MGTRQKGVCQDVGRTNESFASYSSSSNSIIIVRYDFNSITPGILGEKQKENIMKRTILLVVCALFMVVMMSGVALSAEKKAVEQETMITGTINDANQLVDKDGQAFGVADNEQGKELLTHVGETVEVKGTVMESEGQKQIDVSTYKVIKK